MVNLLYGKSNNFWLPTTPAEGHSVERVGGGALRSLHICGRHAARKDAARSWAQARNGPTGP